MRFLLLVLALLLSVVVVSDASAQCANGNCGPAFPVASRAAYGVYRGVQYAAAPVRYAVSPAYRYQVQMSPQAYYGPRFYSAPAYYGRPVYYAPQVRYFNSGVSFSSGPCVGGNCR